MKYLIILAFIFGCSRQVDRSDIFHKSVEKAECACKSYGGLEGIFLTIRFSKVAWAAVCREDKGFYSYDEVVGCD